MSALFKTTGQRPAARQALVAARSFSTTSVSNQVPPESPSFIRLPTPPLSQNSEDKAPRVRGHLPTPRDVFPSGSDGDKKLRFHGDKAAGVSQKYIKKAAPGREQPSRSREVDHAKWEMAKFRRQNLKSGLKELWVRKQDRAAAREEVVGSKFHENHTASHRPEREDDRLTRSTILDAVLDTTVYPDPDRFARADRSRARVEAIQNTKKEARRDALMELYINASNFIVTEKELKAEIDTIFADDFFKKQGQAVGKYGSAVNTWDVWGKPTSIGNMLESTTGTSTKTMDFFESEYDRSVKRQKRIAEEFTGGKME